VSGRRDVAADVVLAEVDAVVVGLGWAGAIVAGELARAGWTVVGLERGPAREATALFAKHDELRFKVRHELMQDVARETWTFRHHPREAALPVRRLGAFLPGTGVGGSALHYGGSLVRFPPWEFELPSRTRARYGAAALPADATVEDWGIAYRDLEPDYVRFERSAGVSGEVGENPFDGPRSAAFPQAPPILGEATTCFGDAARSLGLHPYPMPLALRSGEIAPPGGPPGRCTYCGDCTYHPCAVAARADPTTTVLPLGQATGRLEVRPLAQVRRVVHERGRARAVRYQTLDGTVVEQPARVVVLAAYTFGNVRLLLLSGLGEPYDPATGSGQVGRNYAYNVHARGTAFFAGRRFKNYMAAGAGGYGVADFAADNFDHTGLGFIGGAHLQVAPGAPPITTLTVPPGTPSWGSGWRRAIREWYDRSLTVSAVGSVLAYRDTCLDLDPRYLDVWGDPLLRITFDWHPNELAIAAYAAERITEILHAMRPDRIAVQADSGHFDVVPYQGTHNTGGAIMGAGPGRSVVDPDLRLWDAENVWVVGGSAFPQNGTPGPTATIGALAYRAARAILREKLS
jgi:gluconate 2-dehydrogenase alpha chain